MNKLLSDKLFAISFLSGVAALIYEHVCYRYLLLLLGGETYTIALVVGSYMIGLSAGGILFGALADKNHASALKLSVFGFALFCVTSPLLYHVVKGLSSNHAGAGLLISFIFMLPATICAGGIIPCLVRVGGGKKKAAAIYAVNTLGSLFGVLLSGYVLVRYLGLSGSMLLAFGVMLLGGVLAFFVTRPQTTPSPASRVAVSAAAGIPKAVAVSMIAAYCVSGFSSMSFQLLQTRVLILFFRDSVYDFAIILAVFITGLFIGNLFGGRAGKTKEGILLAFATTQILAGVTIVIGLYIVPLLPGLTYDITSPMIMADRFGGSSFMAANLLKALYAAVIIFPPTFFWGAGFPLLSRMVLTGGRSDGKIAGITTGVNALFCALGPLAAAFFLIDAFGIRNLILLTGGFCVLAGTVFMGIGLGLEKIRRCRPVLAGLLLAATALIIFVPKWDRFEMSTSFLVPGQDVDGIAHLPYYKEDAYGITSVAEFIFDGSKYLTTNRRYCQNTSVSVGPEDHRRLGALPLLIHPNPNDVLVVGLGTGITLSGADEVSGADIDCVEISNAVVEAASFFTAENNDVLQKENVHIIVDDGRNFIKNTDKKYDVIIADIFFPMSSGSSNLYSREYYDMCAGLLNDGGIMAQWIPIHQFSKYELNIVMNTFSNTFDECQLWFGLVGTSVPVIGLVGSQSPLIMDGDRLFERYSDPKMSDILSGMTLNNTYMTLSHYICDIRDIPSFGVGIPLNTDDRPRLEYLNPENTSTPRERAEENMLYVCGLKMSLPQKNARNIDEAELDMYNAEIFEYISQVFGS